MKNIFNLNIVLKNFNFICAAYENMTFFYFAAPIGQAIANYDFSATSNNMLSLHKGDRITILSKAGGEKGWWKGQIEQRVSFIFLIQVGHR